MGLCRVLELRSVRLREHAIAQGRLLRVQAPARLLPGGAKVSRRKVGAPEAFAHQLFILGSSMRRKGDGWVWVRGKRKTLPDLVEVEIYPSTSGKRPDFRVAVCFGGQVIDEDWKPTEVDAARYAERRLRAYMRAIGGER